MTKKIRKFQNKGVGGNSFCLRERKAYITEVHNKSTQQTDEKLNDSFNNDK